MIENEDVCVRGLNVARLTRNIIVALNLQQLSFLIFMLCRNIILYGTIFPITSRKYRLKIIVIIIVSINFN